MLQQSMRRGSEGFLDTQGEMVDLGPFVALRNVNAKSDTLKFELSARDLNSPSHSLSNYLRDKDLDPFKCDLNYSISGEVKYYEDFRFQGDTTKFSLRAGNRVLLTKTREISENTKFLEFHNGTQLGDESQRGLNDLVVVDQAVNNFAKLINRINYIYPNKEVLLPHFRTYDSYNARHVGFTGANSLHHLWKLSEDKIKSKFLSEHFDRVLDLIDWGFHEKDRTVELFATSKETGARTNLANFGFGVSQLIPIFVQGAICHPRDTLIVEHPEAHIHPTAELEFGSFVSKLWTEQKVGTVVETHSRNIVLRLRRLVVEQELDPKEISIVFFDYEDGNPIVKNLEIDSDGMIKGELPMEFFNEDIYEGLKLRSSKFRDSTNDD